MDTDFIKNLDNQELIELLASLETIDEELSKKVGETHE